MNIHSDRVTESNTGFKTNLSRVSYALVATMAMICFGHTSAQAAVSASPNPSTNGSYTVSWSNSGADWYELYSENTSGGWTEIYSGSATSRAFSSQPDGLYSYRVEECTEEVEYDEEEDEEIVIIECDVQGSVDVSVLRLYSAPSQGTVSHVGTTEYLLDVDSQGDAVMSVPVNVTPGVVGLAPRLSLEYDSGRGVDRLERSVPDDTLGYGWWLDGLSSIRRCVVNQAASASIQLNINDSLCLDGMPLVRTSGTHLAVGAVYRTTIESYVRVEIKGATGALWFEVKLPDGTVQEYGSSSGSRVNKSGGVDYEWSLSKETSPDGPASISYTYVPFPSNGTNVIRSISYNDATIDFRYQSRSDASSVSIGSVTQLREHYLHTIEVGYDGKKTREYRLLSEVVNGRRRLNKIQHCGYDEAGVSISCLAPIDLDWLTPSSSISSVPILVDGLLDGLGAVHQIEYGTISGSSHPFLFTERPFGNGSLPANTQLLSGSGALRHVATKVRKDNGIGGFHDTSYAYQNKGIVSTKHWGFLGFYAVRAKDEQSGIVSYSQYRMDYPHFGSVARLNQYQGTYPSHTQLLTQQERSYGSTTINHGASTTILPYLSTFVDFIREGSSQLGGSKTTNVPTYSSGFVSKLTTTVQTGSGVSSGSSGGTWGDVPARTISGVLRTHETEVDFTNRTSGGNWLINFTNAITEESWPGPKSGTGIVRDMTMSPRSNSLQVASSTRFPNDASLTLTTTTTYNGRGQPITGVTSGDNVTSRTSRINWYVDDRYPGEVENEEGHTSNNSAYDSRFGLVKTAGDPNGRNTTTLYDPFGRNISRTNSDGVTTTLTINDCPTGCGVTVYGVSPSYYIESDSPITPIQRTYFDVLGRPIRRQVQGLTGSTYRKEDTEYDDQGRIKNQSLPYISGSPESVVFTYDNRNRVTLTTQPDGGSTGTVYSVSGSTLIATTTVNVLKANGTSAGSQFKRDEFNVLGRLTKTTDGYGSSTDPSVTYTYDANGNATTVVVNGGVAGSATTTYEYDAAGNRKKLIDPNTGTVTYTYTGLNQLLTETDNSGQEKSYSFDKIGRPTEISFKNSSGVVVDYYRWTWDGGSYAIGKVSSRKNMSGDFDESYGYYSNSRLRTVNTDVVEIDGTPGPGNLFTRTITYDSYGRVATETYPGTSLQVTRVYNANGYLSQLKRGSTVLYTVNALDQFGNATSETFGNGVTRTRAFDPESGRLESIYTAKGSTVIQDHSYAWRSNTTLESRAANAAAGVSSNREEVFTYDVLNRVESAKAYLNGSLSRTLTNTFDDLGNLKSKTSSVSGDVSIPSLTYGAGSAGPNAVTSATISGVGHTLTYDANGAIEKYDISGTVDDRYISYNADNQPDKIVVGSSLSDSTPEALDRFAYRHGRNRYARKSVWKEGATSVTEDTRYIGNVEVTETNDASVPFDTITRVRIADGITYIRTFDGVSHSEFFEYTHRDHLGSIDVMTGGSGTVLDVAAYDPYGARKAKAWNSDVPLAELDSLLDLSATQSRKSWGFTGHEHMDRTGLVHMNGRVFDPAIGRFLSPDPIVQFPRHSQSWNRYSYVMNSPISLVDPSGFQSVPIDISFDDDLGCGGGDWCKTILDDYFDGDSYCFGNQVCHKPASVYGGDLDRCDFENCDSYSRLVLTDPLSPNVSESIGASLFQMQDRSATALGVGAGIIERQSDLFLNFNPAGNRVNARFYFQNPSAFLAPAFSVRRMSSVERFFAKGQVYPAADIAKFIGKGTFGFGMVFTPVLIHDDVASGMHPARVAAATTLDFAAGAMAVHVPIGTLIGGSILIWDPIRNPAPGRSLFDDSSPIDQLDYSNFLW